MAVRGASGRFHDGSNGENSVRETMNLKREKKNRWGDNVRAKNKNSTRAPQPNKRLKQDKLRFSRNERCSIHGWMRTMMEGETQKK